MQGFRPTDFRHNALPELDIDEIDTTATLLNRAFSIPLFISSMTGGYSGAARVNEIIARVCEQENIPFGVGGVSEPSWMIQALQLPLA